MFKSKRTHILERRMYPNGVIKALQVLENGGTGLLSGLEAHSTGALPGQGGKERLHGRVVITVPGSTHAHVEASFADHRLIALTGKLTATIGMVQESSRWMTSGQGHPQ